MASKSGERSLTHWLIKPPTIRRNITQSSPASRHEVPRNVPQRSCAAGNSDRLRTASRATKQLDSLHSLSECRRSSVMLNGILHPSSHVFRSYSSMEQLRKLLSFHHPQLIGNCLFDETINRYIHALRRYRHFPVQFRR